MSGRVIELVLYVADTATAAAFLQSAAELELIEVKPDFTVLLANNGLRVALRPLCFAAANAAGDTVPDAIPPAAELVLSSDDVVASHDRAVALGGESLMTARALPYGAAATVRGPGGLRLTWFTAGGPAGATDR